MPSKPKYAPGNLPVKITLRLVILGEDPQLPPSLISAVEFPHWDEGTWYQLDNERPLDQLTLQRAREFRTHWESLAGDVGADFALEPDVQDWFDEQEQT